MLRVAELSRRTMDSVRVATRLYFEPLSTASDVGSMAFKTGVAALKRSYAALAGLIGLLAVFGSSTIAADPPMVSRLLLGLGLTLLTAMVVSVVFARQVDRHASKVFPGGNEEVADSFGHPGPAISAMYASRAATLSALVDVVSHEHREIRVMASTLAWLSRTESQNVASALRRQIRESVRVRFLLIHPAVADLRANQESRRWSEMGREVLHTLTVLHDWGVPPADVRLYRGVQTWTGIIASDKMVFSIYQVTRSAYDSQGSPGLFIEAAGRGHAYEILSTDFERAWASSASEQFDNFEKVADEIGGSLEIYSDRVRRLFDVRPG